MPRMPATKTKSPARVPRFQVPVGLMAPSGDSVFTPCGETCCANAGPEIKSSTPMTARVSLDMSPSKDCYGGLLRWIATVPIVAALGDGASPTVEAQVDAKAIAGPLGTQSSH